MRFTIWCAPYLRYQFYLGVSISWSGTGTGIFICTGGVDKFDRLDVIVVAETSADCQNHIIVVDSTRIVTRMSKLRSTTFSLALSRSCGRTSTSRPAIGALFTVSSAHNLNIIVKSGSNDLQVVKGRSLSVSDQVTVHSLRFWPRKNWPWLVRG